MNIFNKVNFPENIKTAEIAANISGINWIANDSLYTIKLNNNVSTLAKAIIRSDNQYELGSVGINYCPIQPIEGWTFLDAICEKYGATYKYAIEIHGGRKVLIYAEMPDPIELREGDLIMKGFLLTNGFDGINGLHASFILQRLLNNTTLRAEIKDVDNGLSLKHTKNVKLKMEEAFKMFGLSLKFFEEFEKSARLLLSKELTDKKVEKYLQELFKNSDSKKSDNKRDEIRGLFKKHDQNAWQLYASVIEYIDYHSKKDIAKMNVYSTIGAGTFLKERAFDLIIKL
jgi:phage/plasmid-like protein (TIGR03299 family)